MAQLKTPGVYTKETPTLAPSVAEVATAIPVFIGYTEKTQELDADGLPQLVRVGSMLEYREEFGAAYLDPAYTVKVKGYEILDIQTPKTSYMLSPCMEFFYKNGGGVSYVISLGTYEDTFDKAKFEAALRTLEKTDVPTLICLTDAVNLDPDDYHDLIQQSLLQCAGMDNRFCILDVLNQDRDGNTYSIEDAATAFRESIGNNNLQYGAAYYPDVRTTLTHAFTDESVRLLGYDDDIAQYIANPNGVAFYFQGDDSVIPQVEVINATADGVAASYSATDTKLTLTIPKDAEGITPADAIKLWKKVIKAERKGFNVAIQGGGDALLTPFAVQSMVYHEGRAIQDANGLGVFYHGPLSSNAKVVVSKSNTTTEFTLTPQTTPGTSAILEIKFKESSPTMKELMKAWDKVKDKQLFTIKAMGDGTTAVTEQAETALEFATSEIKLKDIKFDKGALYNDILAELKLKRMVLPPSTGIAGIYANIDSTFGVWQAPANTGIASVIEPQRRLNNREQENLNVDVNAGKSINVIRNFTGKGNLVWGARTLAGNDNEWRYVNVRRLFNMVKASLQKATGFAVFQPNTPITWLKVRAMMESYLEDLWQAGGLVGETKEQAFFVRVGKGITMNEQDILEGRMKIDVGLRASRPAEFIVINFTHYVQDN